MPSAVRSTALSGRSQSGRDNLAKSLGYLSLALGAAELMAPRAISRTVGVRGVENLIRAYGAREIATGLAILMSHNAEPWIWARVAGDIADMATVASGLRQDNAKRDTNVLALGALAAVTALDVACARGLKSEKGNRKTATADYSDRSGFPGGLQAAWGAAQDALISEDMKTPPPLRAFEISIMTETVPGW